MSMFALTSVGGRTCAEVSVRVTVIFCTSLTPVRFTVIVLPEKWGLPETVPVPRVRLALPLTTGLLKEKTNLCLPARFRHSKPGSPASGRFGGLKRTMERPGGNSRARFSLYAKDQIMKKSKLCQGEIRNSFRKRVGNSLSFGVSLRRM